MPPFDQSSTAIDLERVSAMLSPAVEDDAWVGRFEGLVLRTALQPIFSISHKRIVGYEALIRAFDNDSAPVLPPHLFDLAEDHPSNLLLDRKVSYIQPTSGVGVGASRIAYDANFLCQNHTS